MNLKQSTNSHIVGAVPYLNNYTVTPFADDDFMAWRRAMPSV